MALTSPEAVSATSLVLSAGAGAVLGAGHFWGLWMTVRSLSEARRPWLMIASSFLARTGLTVLGFALLVRGGGWPWLAAALAGFMLVRFAVVRYVGGADDLMGQAR